MYVAVIALSLQAFALHALPPPALADSVPASHDDVVIRIAQADPGDAFGDPPPPPAVPEAPAADESKAPLAPAPAEPVPPEPVRTDEAPADRSESSPDDDGAAPEEEQAVDAMLAGIITGVGSAVLAVPAAALCGVCSCFACPGPLVCVPLGTAGSAAGGLLFAGADFGDVIVPSLAAGAISFASGVLALGGVLLYSVLTGAINNVSQVVNTPAVSQGVGALGTLIVVGIVLGSLSVGAVGAGAAVMFLAPGSELEESARSVERATPEALERGVPPALASALPRTLPASAMAY